MSLQFYFIIFKANLLLLTCLIFLNIFYKIFVLFLCPIRILNLKGLTSIAIIVNSLCQCIIFFTKWVFTVIKWLELLLYSTPLFPSTIFIQNKSLSFTFYPLLLVNFAGWLHFLLFVRRKKVTFGPSFRLMLWILFTFYTFHIFWNWKNLIK